MNAVGSAIYARLSAGTALTATLGGTYIYNTIAPQGTALTKYVVFGKMAGTEDNTSPRRARSLVYMAKAVVKNDFETAGEIDDLIDGLMHEKPLTVAGYNTYWTMRESDISYAEPAEGGVVYYHRGGQYRIRIAE